MHSRHLEAMKMPQILTTKEVAEYLKLHKITVCKHAPEGKIPAIRIGRVWRFDKEAIDLWIRGETRAPTIEGESKNNPIGV